MQHKFTFKNHLKRAALTLLALIMTCATAWAQTKTVEYVLSRVGTGNADEEAIYGLFLREEVINSQCVQTQHDFTVTLSNDNHDASFVFQNNLDITLNWSSTLCGFHMQHYKDHESLPYNENGEYWWDRGFFYGAHISSYANDEWTVTIGSLIPDYSRIAHVKFYNKEDELKYETDNYSPGACTVTLNNVLMGAYQPSGNTPGNKDGVHRMVITFTPLPPVSWSGSGTEADPFLITNSTDLEALRNFVSYGNNYNGYWFKQTQPIDLSGVSNWTPIGNSSNKFGGNYDGDNNPITGLTISDSNDTYSGLFGYVSNDEIIQGNQAHCQLKNIIINGCNISGSGTIGGIVGYGTYIDFTNCQITGNITTTGQVGGIIGYMDKGSITNCFTSATVVDTESDNGSYRQGLFVGELANSSISFSSSDNYYRTTQSGINPVGVYSGASASGTFNAAPVYSVTCPTGLATTGTATVIHDESRYYAASATATVAVTDPSQAILTLNATSGSISNVVIANDKHSATFTMGSGDVTLTATYSAISGTCGNNGQVTWSLGGTNYTELTIDGTGAMDDFSCDSNGKTTAPWGYNITSVNVGNGVTRIGNYAFSGCQQLATVSLGSGLTTIGNYAFSGCQQLATVSLPNNVTSIGEYAFSGCQQLATVSLGSSLTTIGNYAFSGCQQLATVSLPNSVTSIGEYAFSGCLQLATINLGNGLTSIGNNAFANCAMTEITLPSNVATLNAGLFANCASLQRVNFLHNGAITLGSGVFSGCNSLQYLVFPSPTNALTHIQTTGNWASYQAKIRARFGNQHFTATNEGGTAAYAITNESDLRNLATAVNAGNNGSGQTFLQTADITLNGSFTPIGIYINASSIRKFSGTYDGGDNTISGLNISGNHQYAGLFGQVDIGGTVKNVRLVNPSVTSSSSGAHVAALIGGANQCTVQNCLVVNPTVSATASSNKNEVGVLFGDLANSTVQNCIVISPTVSGESTNYVGVICGNAFNGGPTYHCTLTNVYYYNSSLGAIGFNNNPGYSSLTNVGPVRKVTLGSGMANVSPEATNMANGFVYDNETYYREGLTLTLTDNLGTTSEGYTKHYYANGTDLNGSTTYTVNSTDGDVTFTADCLSDGESHAVTYVDANGTEHSTSAIPLDGTMTTLNGTYYVGANITFTSTITLNGNTTLILVNGKTMNVGTSDNRISGKGIKDEYSRYTLTIYGQSLDEATAGHLNIYNSGSDGIYLDSYNQQSGNVTVNSTTNGNYTISCNYFTLSGGKLNAINNHTDGLGIFGFDQIRILGGQLDTYVSNNNKRALISYRSITLGWTNATDYIHASSYDGPVNIASGQVFVTNDPTPDTITGNNIDESRINGKILRPILTGSGTTDDPYLITNAGGWDLFCDLIENSTSSFTDNVKLCANISVSRMAGSESKPFCGNFDGQNNTLTFNYNTNDNYVAPFRYVKGSIGNAYHHATISNLYVDSHIIGENATHLAGLIANQKGLVDVTNCHVQAAITSTATTDSYCAGLVSHADLSDNYGHANDGTLSISGCTVSGLISTYGKYAGGFVGMAEGKTSIVNSLSGVTIESFVSGNGTHGGFIGLQQNTMNYTSVKTTFEGCLFNGKLLSTGTTATTSCGGFIGWHNGGELEIKYCLYAPADLNSNETAVIDGSTFVGNGTVGFNCIYTRALGTAQGKATRSIVAGQYVTISNIELISLTDPDDYNVSGITSYDYGGISCGGNLYICENAYVSLVLSNDYPDPAPAGSVYGYTTSGGELEGTANPYTLTMPDADVTIDVDPDNTITLEWSGTGTESDPYMIYSKEQLDMVASRMYQHGYNYGSDQDYEGHPDGYFFKLGADIVYPYTSSTENNFTPIGNSAGMNNYPSFQGTFDGDGHTISGIRIKDEYFFDNGYYFEYFGLFGEVVGTVKNVTLADAVITGSSNLGGIVGHNYNGTIKDNLVIGTTISTTDDYDYGVICGENYHGTLERNYYVGCTVAGVENATGVGCGYIYDDDEGDYITADITENDGAMPGNARTVEGYNGGDGGWVFISSPVTGSIAPNTVANIFSATDYDLYRFNQDAEKEWQNWKVGDGHNAASGFSFVNGQGYLYATKETKTLVFSGEFNNASSQEVSLAYNADAEFAGWNLVGNPLIVAANITDNEGNNKPFYVISGRNVVANTGSTIIEPCTGVMVKANGTGESVTFRRATASSSALQPNQLQMTLAQQVVNRGGVSSTTVDNAIVSFNEGNLLEKFVFNADLAKLYIPQGGKDFAIVTSEGQGEIPVNFKAMENGTYTITVNPEGVEMGYLHLIDNMTGADVDLLAASCTDGACTVSTAPSYTFTARTTDYESRFKLVFVCGDADDDDDTFAFFSNGSFVISNEGRATLQVIDVNGRIISSEQINGSVSKAIHAAPGVYMIRLVNGDDVKVQKVVVR